MDGPIRILLVSTHSQELEFHQQLLIQNFDQDYDICAVMSLSEARDKIADFSPDCVLLDQCDFIKASQNIIHEFELLNNGDKLAFVLLSDKHHIDKLDYHHLLKTEITSEKLQRTIQTALDEVGENQLSRISYFSEELNETENQSLNILENLSAAIKRKELYLEYRPIMNLFDEDVIAMDVALHWQHSNFDIIGRKRFLPLAERSGLIVELGQWMLKQSVQDAMHWNQDKNLPFVLPITARQLEDESFIECLTDYLHDNHLQPNLMALQVNDDVLASMQACHQDVLCHCINLGMALVIDDLNISREHYHYFYEYPIHYAKVSARKLMQKPEYAQSIANYTRSSNIQLIATELDNCHDIQCVYELGCRFGMGASVDIISSRNRSSLG